MISSKTIGALGFLILVFVIGFSPVPVNAQRSRTRPKPLATPPRVLSGAEIISQGGDVEDPAVVVQPVETPPAKPAVTNAARIKEINDRLNKLEAAKKNDYEEQQKRLLMNLDIIARAEGRTESLRKQLFEMIEKENTLKSRIEQIDYDIRPEIIERALQISGSMKPEEIRENRRKNLDAERLNLETLLTQVQSTRANLESNLQRADAMLERLRTKLERDIDNAFPTEEPEK